MSVLGPICTNAIAVIRLLFCGMFLLLVTSLLQAAPEVSDRTISDAVEDELRLDSIVSEAWVDIATREGIVTLSGWLDNLLSKQRAARIAETVKFRTPISGTRCGMPSARILG